MHPLRSAFGLALVATACTPNPSEQPSKPSQPAHDAGGPTPVPPAGPFARALATRVLATSGLDVGSTLSAFDIIHPDSGERYCQICRFGPRPKLLAVGTVDDEAFHNDLKDLDAILHKYGADKIGAFAVLTDLKDGHAVTPARPGAAKTAAGALAAELDVGFPLVVPAPPDPADDRVWELYYNITASRTIMFANGRNEVKYSAVEPEDFAALGAAIEAELAT